MHSAHFKLASRSKVSGGAETALPPRRSKRKLPEIMGLFEAGERHAAFETKCPRGSEEGTPPPNQAGGLGEECGGRRRSNQMSVSILLINTLPLQPRIYIGAAASNHVTCTINSIRILSCLPHSSQKAAYCDAARAAAVAPDADPIQSRASTVPPSSSPRPPTERHHRTLIPRPSELHGLHSGHGGGRESPPRDGHGCSLRGEDAEQWHIHIELAEPLAQGVGPESSEQATPDCVDPCHRAPGAGAPGTESERCGDSDNETSDPESYWTWDPVIKRFYHWDKEEQQTVLCPEEFD